jgi:hypothetical protein
MKITTELIAKFNPCSDRFDNWKLHYGDKKPSLRKFTELVNISHSDKVWVLVRLLSNESKIVFTIDMALSAVRYTSYNAAYAAHYIDAAYQDIYYADAACYSAYAATDAVYYAAYAAAAAAAYAAADANDVHAAYAAADAATAAATAAYAAAYAAADAATARKKEESEQLEILLYLIENDNK